ncbi:MAG: SPOR domain-containing protein [Candidatus Omnitrophica bacterium]|jgi:cell division protein FtsN|nr:SPOR domain-containing protein [Candidatus Omnitrophota bacterium]MDD5080984.1 SPOR domain-containing protein [Candidatus Omnitrophota bacterium]MDD5441221.1 SPOR domain-containing protein [Candidatus Omnitrophota bacterium]
MKGKQLHLFGYQETPKFGTQRTTITLPRDTLVLGLVIVGLLLIVAFSLGVERGRKLAYLKEQKQTVSREVLPAEAQVYSETRQEALINEQAPVLSETVSDNNAVQETMQQEGYVIQVASYKAETRAKKESDDLESKGFGVITKKTSNDYYVVYVGTFNSKAEAEKELNKLKKKYKDGFVKKYRL